MKKVALAAMLLSLAAAAPASAQPVFFTDAHLSTLGVGLDFGTQFNDMFKVRLNTNFFPGGGVFGYAGRRAADEIGDDVDTKISAHQYSIGLLGDVHPFSGTFRVTGGVYYLRHDLSANIRPNANAGTFDLGDNDYLPYVDSLDAEIKWRKIAPYLGIGWGTGAGTQSGLSFDTSIGVLYSKPTLTVEPRGVHGLTPEQTAQLYRDIDQEKADVDDYLKWMRYYPVITVGLTYRF